MLKSAMHNNARTRSFSRSGYRFPGFLAQARFQQAACGSEASIMHE
jgi:hypothetical protein